MRRILSILAIGLLMLPTQRTFAVQGNLQSSSGYVASSMGGATVAQFSNEFDAVIDNPALMQQTKTRAGTHKFSLGLEYAKYTNYFYASYVPGSSDYEKGKVDTAWIPFVGYFYNINENFKFGTGFFAIGGTGYDYSDTIYQTKGLYRAISIPLAISYRLSDMVNLGASLNLVYTDLSSNNFGASDKKASATNLTPGVGVTFAFPHSLLFGANLTLGTSSTFDGLYVVSGQDYDVKVGTPLQFSLGLGQNTSSYSIGFKYRFVNWANTENYKQLDWKNQSTYSLGGSYNFAEQIVGRAGIYYVSTVYSETSNINGDAQQEIQGVMSPKYLRDHSNAMMYGIPQWQYAIGMGYKFNPKSILDFGIIYESEKSISFTGTSSIVGNYEVKKKNMNLQIFFTYSQEV